MEEERQRRSGGAFDPEQRGAAGVQQREVHVAP